jgi:lysophospholipase L1-like esterase
MTLKSRVRQVSVIGAGLIVAAATVLTAVPAHGAPPGGQPTPPAAGKVAFVALGDSYAAGVGGGDYLDPCLTSPNGYAALLADEPGQVHAELRGCVGATTDQVVATQLAGLDLRTKTVTLTVGANDLGVAALATTCLSGAPEACLASVQATLALLPSLSADLAGTLAAIREAAPKATVYVTGYPLFFDNALPGSLQFAVNQAIALVNDTIEATVAAAGAGFVYVDVEGVFAGHGIDSADPWIIAPPHPEAFHPNAAGHAAYADAILAAR